VKIPQAVLRELFGHREFSVIDKVIYLVAAICLPNSLAELCAQARVSRSATLRACRHLARLGWMVLVKTGKRIRPVAVVPYQYQTKMAQDLERLYRLVGNKGEFLMKRYLDLRICSDEFIDNARPEFLVNPMTDELLEYDRYYMSRVAFEFNGPQHHSTTKAFPDEKALKKIKTRDLVKRALSDKAGVKLITITAQDLRPDALGRRIPDDLPLNPIDDGGPYFKALARICSAYADKATRPSDAEQPVKAGAKK